MKALFALVVCALAGCAAIERNEIHQQAIWLEKAGFRTVKSNLPATSAPRQTSMTFQEIINKDGTATYAFTDSVNGLVYAGGEREMAAYQEISVRAKSKRASTLAQIRPAGSRVTGPLVW